MNLYMRPFGLMLTAFYIFLFAEFAFAQIAATKDNTLYQDAEGSLSNGAGDHLFAGVNNNGGILRGLISFDLSEAIPSNATITSVTLTLNMSRSRASTETVSIHRVEKDWGEGSSHAGGEEGGGADATANDATWIHTFFSSDEWANPGGDFNADPSASIPVAGNGRYTWGSTSNMVTDVQAWIEDPSQNFGWIVIGDESSEQTAKRFDSRTNPTASNRPVLNVSYSIPNQNPVANNDNAQTNEDNNVNINVLANDTDDGSLDASSVTIVNAPANGSVTNINPSTGVITYDPDENYNGSDSFTYTVDDDQGATSNQATVSISITSVNDAPTAVNDNAVTNEDNAVIINVLTNDSDLDGTLAAGTVTIINQPDNGTITNINGSTGAITYMPASNYAGADAFSYTVEDNNGAVSSEATVSVTVNQVNDAPQAVNDNGTTNEDQAIIIPVLANDIDIDGTLVPSSVNIVNSPANGTVSNINISTGAITYTPDEDYNGGDSFTYTVADNNGAVSNQAAVSVTIDPVNDAPVAVNDAEATNEDNAVIINVLNNDSDSDGDPDPSTVTVTNDPANGTITNINAGTGAITYSPDANYYGMDSFMYTFEDNGGLTSTVASVTVTVFSVNDAPVANNDMTATSEETSVQFNILLNDSDIDGKLNAASVAIIDNPENGQITNINTANGVVTYLPDINFNGDDTFTYTVQDDSGDVSNTATVTINVTAINDPPVTVSDAVQTNEDNAVIIDVLNNDSDSDGTLTPSTVVIVNNPANGAITNINTSSGAVTYSPNSNYYGSDAFTYRVQDNNGATSNQSTVSVTVLSKNDAPVAQNDAANTEENMAVLINVLENDSDIDGSLDISSVNIIAGPQHGSAQTEANGQISYTPQNNFNGVDSLTYTVSDDSAAVSNPATVILSVGAVNDLPVAVTDNASTNEDENVQIDILANDFDTDGTIIPSTVTIVNSPQHGSITAVNQSTGVVTYVPNGNYFGSDNFTYTVKDDSNATSSQTQVSILIHSVNDIPVAGNDSGNTSEETAVIIDVLDNDQDIDGTLLASTIAVSEPANGIITNINTENGAITYLPDNDFNGTDQFTYTVQDDSGAVSNQATVTVNVSNTNDAPLISSLPLIAFNEDDSLQVMTSIWFDFISDNETADSALNIQVFNGQFVKVMLTEEQMTFYAPANWHGMDTLNLTVSDGQLSDQSSFPVNVFSVNDLPYFNGLTDSIEFFNDQSVMIELNNFVMDNDLPMDNLTFQFLPDNDSLVIDLDSETNTATVSAPGFEGMVILDVIVTDDSLASAQASIVVDVLNVVTGLPEMVIAAPDQYAISQNFPNPFNPLTRIEYQLPHDSHVLLKIYDIRGREVAALVNNRQAAGRYTVDFDGSSLASGIYFYRISAGSFTKIKRMLLLK